MIRRFLAAILLLVAAQAQSFLPNGSFTAPALDYNFSASSYYQPAVPGCVSAATCITTTRASTGYADNLEGVWTSFAVDTPRITDKGLLIEEARTNSIRNNSMQDAVAGTPGTPPTNWTITATGLTIQLVGVGTQLGVDYVEYRFSGTTGATFGLISFETTTQIVAANAETWVESLFTSFTNTTNIASVQLLIGEKTAAGGFIQNDALTIAPSTSLARFPFIKTLSGGATVARIQPGLLMNWSIGVAVDFTIRVGWPQIELGAFATSPIRTTTVAVTRAADVVTVATLPSFTGSYTLLAKATPITPITNGSAQAWLSVDDGTLNNRSQIARVSASGFGGITGVAASVQYYSTSGAPALANGSSSKIAGAFAPSDQAFVGNGGTILTNSTGTPLSVPTIIHVGSRADGAIQTNGYIERIALWPTTRLSNAALQKITQ